MLPSLERLPSAHETTTAEEEEEEEEVGSVRNHVNHLSWSFNFVLFDGCVLVFDCCDGDHHLLEDALQEEGTECMEAPFCGIGTTLHAGSRSPQLECTAVNTDVRSRSRCGCVSKRPVSPTRAVQGCAGQCRYFALTAIFASP